MATQNKKVEVERSVFILLKKGETKIHCEMTDGSKWQCSKDFKDWICLKPSEQELNKHFQEFIAKNKK